MERLRAGVAHAVINPPSGTDLTGYAGRSSGCKGIHDGLHAKALVISDGQTRAAIVSLDILGLAAYHVAAVRETVESATGIPAANLLIGTSHTHSGPATQFLRACGEVCDHYLDTLLARIADTVAEASENMFPASFGHDEGSADVAINRRASDGPRDCTVAIWRFTRENGAPLATLFNHACHAVVLEGSNLLVSADWPGAAQRAIEGELGGQAMFLQGCCGNINPRDRGGYDVMERVGRQVAASVESVINDIPTRPDVRLRIAAETVHLPLRPPPSRDDLEATVREMDGLLAGADESTPLGAIHIWTAYRDWARTLLDTAEHPVSVPIEIQRLTLGDAHMLALPGEIFVEYALRLKSRAPNLMVVGYANGNIGYVPTASAFVVGGYEVDDACRLYGQYALTPECEDIILRAANCLLSI